MRVLFTSGPGYRHAQPMLPLARALRKAGNYVAIATVPELLPRAEATAFYPWTCPATAAPTEATLTSGRWRIGRR